LLIVYFLVFKKALLSNFLATRLSRQEEITRSKLAGNKEKDNYLNEGEDRNQTPIPTLRQQKNSKS
jgi:hypothetical protein